MIQVRRYQPGDVIIKEDEPGEVAYIILDGQVEITKQKNGETIHLAYRNVKEIFGEMSIIDEKPRSASVTAVTDTTLKEIHRDDLLEILKNDQESAVALLKTLFNRFRETSQEVLELKAAQGQSAADEPKRKVVTLSATLQGLTPRAAESLPVNPLVIDDFPFRIGRTSGDLLTYNDLTISDKKPFQLSRHHITLFEENGRLGVSDRGSTLGAEVDGRRFGGRSHTTGPVFFEGAEGILVLGTAESPYRYKVSIAAKHG